MNEERRRSAAPENGSSAALSGETLAADDDVLLTAEQVAAMLQVATSWVRSATREGRLPVVSVGRWRRYRKASVLAWVEERESG
jgi:excisionase family DNA binding protein